MNATKIKGKKTQGSSQYTLLIALLVIVLAFEFLTDGKVFTPMNINNLIMQNSYIIILTVGMLQCILLGGINIAVGSAVALCGGVGAVLICQQGAPVWLAVLVVFAVGITVGCLEGFFVAYLNIPAFIVTLADMMILRGLVLALMNAQTIGPLPSNVTIIGAGHIPSPTIVTETGKLNVLALVTLVVVSILVVVIQIYSRKKNERLDIPNVPWWNTVIKTALILLCADFVLFKLAQHKGLPVVLIILAAVALFYAFYTEKTVAGRKVYAVGGNENAARLSGINVKKVKFGVFVNAGLLSALAGLVLIARNASATPSAGEGFEMDAIASCFIGGASTAGGVGTVVGCLTGALIMGCLNNGMSLMGLSSYWQRVVKGVVLLAAVIIDLYNKRKNSR